MRSPFAPPDASDAPERSDIPALPCRGLGARHASETAGYSVAASHPSPARRDDALRGPAEERSLTYPRSDEEREFRDVLRRCLAEAAPPSEVRRLWDGEPGFDEGVWKQLCEELALPGVAIAEARGGQGFGLVELGLAQAELGRALACAPFFATAVLAGRATARAAQAAERDELLAAIAAGERMTLAWVEPGRGWDPAELAMEARPADGAWTLDGAKHLVVDGHTAARILVAAREPGSRGLEGLGLFAVAGDAPGLARRRQDSVDRSRALARLDFSGVRARRVGEAGAAGPGLARALDDAAALLGAEIMGGLERVLEAASEHARTRVQFGRPIGSFQAVKHKCADMLIALEAGRSAVSMSAHLCFTAWK